MNVKQINELILRCILLVLFLYGTPFGWALSDVSLSPENPRQGDIITIQIAGSPFEEVDVSISFGEELTVIDSSFTWSNNVKVPIYPNVLSVTAEGVDFIRVSVDVDDLTLTKTGMGTEGVATINHFDVSPGSYMVEISGNSLQGKEKVSIIFNVSSIIRLDTAGEYEATYDSSYLPLGQFKTIVGTIETSVNITDSLPNINPSAYFGLPKKSPLNKMIQLDASGSSDEDGEIIDYIWDINNSIYHGESIVWTPEKAGDYIVTLTVVDDEGAEGVFSNNITVVTSKTWMILGVLVLVFGFLIWGVKKGNK